MAHAASPAHSEDLPRPGPATTTAVAAGGVVVLTFYMAGPMGLRFTSSKKGVPLRLEEFLKPSHAWSASLQQPLLVVGLALVRVAGDAVGARSHAEVVELLREAAKVRPLELRFGPLVHPGVDLPHRPRIRGSPSQYSNGKRETARIPARPGVGPPDNSGGGGGAGAGGGGTIIISSSNSSVVAARDAQVARSKRLGTSACPPGECDTQVNAVPELHPEPEQQPGQGQQDAAQAELLRGTSIGGVVPQHIGTSTPGPGCRGTVPLLRRVLRSPFVEMDAGTCCDGYVPCDSEHCQA